MDNIQRIKDTCVHHHTALNAVMRDEYFQVVIN